MSVQALSWVFDHSPTTGADRLVLLAIANHAGASPRDGAWEAYPGVELIRREAGLARTRTVQEALARLVAAGALVRVVNGAPDERIPHDRRPNLYRIPAHHGVTLGDTPAADDGVTPGATRGDAGQHDGVTPDGATGCRPAAPEPSLEPPEEPSVGTVPTMLEVPDLFETFWSVYPRKVGKPAALKAWTRAIKRAKPAAIIEAAESYARRRAGQDAAYTKHPGPWLNDDRWNDEGAEAAALTGPRVSRSTTSLSEWAARHRDADGHGLPAIGGAR